MLHKSVPILTDVFNHWFAQGAIPTSITKSDHIAEERRQACLGGIRQLQAYRSAKHRVEDFGSDCSKPFADCCQGLDQTLVELCCEEKINLEQSALSVQNHNAVLISLDQSKSFDRVDHWFLAAVLETTGF